MCFVKRLSTVTLLALVASTLIWSPAARAAVPSPSPGCQALNSPSRDGVYTSANLDGFGIGPLSGAPLASGETVTITTSNPTVGLTLTYLEMYDAAVSFAPIVSLQGATPGTVRYTLTTDWNGAQQSIDWGVGLGAGQATIDVSCTPAPLYPSTGSPAAEAPFYVLNMESAPDTDCPVSEVSATRGIWVTLPGTDECSHQNDDARTQLLGWATSANFPLEIARRQVDNGWGAYETFDDTGRLSGVFIPAGGATLVSAPATLHAIWSSPTSD